MVSELAQLYIEVTLIYFFFFFLTLSRGLSYNS